MFKDIDPIAAPITTVIEVAKGHGIHIYLADNPVPRAVIRPHRDPSLAPLVKALIARKEEVAQYLVNRLSLAPGPDADARALHLLREADDDALMAPLTVGEWRAMTCRVVQEAMDAERAAEEWERSIAGRDADPTPSPPPRKRQPARRAAPSDRVVF